MAAEPIEEVVVKLEADYADFLKQIDRAVEESVRKLKQTEEAPQKSKTAFEQLGSYLKGQFIGAVTSVGVAIAAAFAVQNVVNFFKSIGQGMVAANAQFETFKVQFETLLGSTEAAQQRIQELARFGVTTPFELDEIVEADRLLQTFGGDAIATGENLRRIGDSAAAVNANFKEVAFWTGRMYSAIQAGRPFGEAAMRLQELGILSGEARNELEAMQKSGADGQEIWAAYAEMVDTRFAGAMDRLSKTFQGVMSNLADFQNMLLREGGAQFFEGIREDAIDLFDIISQPEAQQALVNLAKSAGLLADMLREIVTTPLLSALGDVDPEEVNKLAESLEDFAQAVGELVGSDTQADINGTITALTSLIDSFTLLINDINSIKEGVNIFGQGLGIVRDVIIDILFPVNNLIQGFGALNDALEQFTGLNISDYTREFTDGIMDSGEAMADLETTGSHALNQLQEGLKQTGEVAQETAEDLSKLKEKVSDLAGDFLDAQEDANSQRLELEKEHGERITEINEDYAERQAEIQKAAGDELAELEQEIAERRQDIAEQTQEALIDLAEETAERRKEAEENARDQLSKLEEDTREQLSQVREEAQVKEKRETEQHQRDMARLHEDYLFDLEDAVKNRDARAIVDLRRRFRREKREREQDFRTKQRDEREDVERRQDEIRENERKRRQEIQKALREQLADIEENEAEKRQEILENQAKQLEDLAEHEAERRAEIQKSLDEQLAKAEEAHAEQLARENERYQERKTALDEALQKRLEDVAKELADEKDINEEGARAILEALNKTFGIGGDIDKLMADFQDRRRAKMTIQIGFEQLMSREGEEPAPTSGRPGRGGTGGGGRRGRGPLRRFQEGGLVPGPIGEPMDAIIHGGEWVIPHEDVKQMIMTRQGNAGSREMRVKLEFSGSAPPGIRGGEVDQIAGVLVRALSDAGIRARR